MATIRDIRDRLIRQEDAETILAPHLDSICKVCLKGMDSWNDFAATQPNLRFALLSRTASNFINDWVVQYAREEFRPDPEAGVDPFDQNGLFVIGFKRRILLRFKRGDDNDSPSNIQTGQQQDIGCQQLTFEGWPEATWLHACYHVTPALDAIDRIVITCRFVGHRLWCIPVFKAGQNENISVLPFVEPQATPQRKSRVVPRNLETPEGE